MAMTRGGPAPRSYQAIRRLTDLGVRTSAVKSAAPARPCRQQAAGRGGGAAEEACGDGAHPAPSSPRRARLDRGARRGRRPASAGLPRGPVG